MVSCAFVGGCVYHFSEWAEVADTLLAPRLSWLGWEIVLTTHQSLGSLHFTLVTASLAREARDKVDIVNGRGRLSK